MNSDIFSHILKEKVVAIIRSTKPDTLLKVVEVLSTNGIQLIEITCNTPNFDNVLKSISQEMGNRIMLGAGTVTCVDLATEAIDAGARYIIAPNLDKEVIIYCQERSIPIIPGVTTPTEILQAFKLGCNLVKLFPAAALGTIYLKQIRGPLDNVKILAVGGVNLNNAREMLAAGADALAVGGSLVNDSLIEKAAWEEIGQRACAFVEATKSK